MNRTKTRWIAAALSAVCCLSASRTNFAGDSGNTTGLSWVVWHPGERRNVVDGSPLEHTAGVLHYTITEPLRDNMLTQSEIDAGWKLLFDGKSLDGWHNFKKTDVRPGWQIKDGNLCCVDPHDAGDLCTKDQYAAFELQLDYTISKGGNSGIMYHVIDKGGAVWATGPEFQLEDNVEAKDPIRCGWLYALYQPPIDPKTNKPLDATKPVGEWNHVRLLISPEKCEHEINGVKYFEYVLGSDDFNARVAKSKFASMPDFAKSPTGYISLQGDHGQVTFKNIKVRAIEAKK